MNGIGATPSPRSRRACCRPLGRLARAAAVAACAGLLAAACSSPGNSGSGGNAPAFTTTAQWGPSSWSYNPFAANSTTYFAAFGVQLPLAVPEKTANQDEMFTMIPQLISSYSLASNNVVTLHMLKGARFSNGEPVDAAHVADFIFLRLLQQNPVFENDIENVTTPNSTTVVISFTPGTANVNVRGVVAGIIPQPMAEYGQFLPRGMGRTLLAYNKLIQNPKTAATAQSSPLYKKIDPYTTKLRNYSPPKLIGDGPFMVTGANTSTITEVKSPTYTGAAHVHVAKLTLLNTASSASSVYPQLYSHELDWYGNASPSSTELSQWKTTSDAHTVRLPNDVTEDMLINNKAYPFSLTPVRQALAYLLNRRTLAETEDGGTLTVTQPSRLPDGLGAVLSGIWLSPSQRARLNPYNYSPPKAAALLKSAGFSKTGGHWVMPNGKRFTAQVIAPSAPQQAPLFAKEAAAELTEFGIPATASTVPAVSYLAQYQKGDFQLAWQYGINSNLEPICGVATSGLGEPTNYAYGSTGALVAGQPGIGFGPSYDVPGLGRVPVSQTSTTECQTTSSGPKMAALSWDWAQVVNKAVPFLSYADDEAVNLYSTDHYTNWPPASSVLWQYTALDVPQPYQGGLMLMIEDGYVSPKSS